MYSPQRLAPQVAGVDVTGTTVFGAGTTTVTSRFRDLSGNVGSAASTVTVRLWGDLNLSNTVTAIDVVIRPSQAVPNLWEGAVFDRLMATVPVSLNRLIPEILLD